MFVSKKQATVKQERPKLIKRECGEVIDLSGDADDAHRRPQKVIKLFSGYGVVDLTDD